ncbi:hypothetical protein CK501_14670 [Halovibrio salipaludis]|uniref:Helix-turn-helix domain-containing protein n=1 Tax=Halovibrio salipaludis TaxID=2032626 RepID=A0A2A2EYS6_9GAMM|nr:hypothetical protein [Halovibrio salipaludis]PAU77700.1 hypothetical protein CK501_14670 [Halovibrio salipaludis]
MIINPRISVIHSRIPFLKADEKLLLILVVGMLEPRLEISRWNVLTDSAPQLAKRLGFSKELAFSCFRKLEESGIVEAVFDQGRVGRPRKFRAVVPRSWDDGETLLRTRKSCLNAICFNLIESRLMEPNSFPLKNSLLMLTLALLAESDDTGVVAQSSHSDLSKLTGIPKAQISRRLRQLKTAGVIAENIPGLLAGSFLGQANSIHYLNLEHPVLTGAGMESHPLPIKGRAIEQPEIDQILKRRGAPGPDDRLSSAEKAAKEDPIPRKVSAISPESWEENAGDALNHEPSKRYLQAAIERHAAKLIGNPLSIMPKGLWREQQDVAANEFIETLLGPAYSAAKVDSTHTRMFYRLCADLEELAHHLADTCLKKRSELERTKRDSPDSHYRILPSGHLKRPTLRLERVTHTNRYHHRQQLPPIP